MIDLDDRPGLRTVDWLMRDGLVERRIEAFAGIERFGAPGESFDPALHEAVAQQPFDGVVAGEIVDVYQGGYRLGGTVIRPARVLVAA
ncbi:MAG TPA: nucleotide exchange factor GrpE [Solirubrobacteraceae bacterium]|nr:nucleotide exchange factor GrpE [Solirubrobacteraceae bacterium]